eukprot:Lankesteria_metandrocarpae@DN3413_c1_g1_i1.p1
MAAANTSLVVVQGRFTCPTLSDSGSSTSGPGSSTSGGAGGDPIVYSIGSVSGSRRGSTTVGGLDDFIAGMDTINSGRVIALLSSSDGDGDDGDVMVGVTDIEPRPMRGHGRVDRHFESEAFSNSPNKSSPITAKHITTLRTAPPTTATATAGAFEDCSSVRYYGSTTGSTTGSTLNNYNPAAPLYN